MSYPRYAPGSHFESCPAATGETGQGSAVCGTYPDRAHRCRHDREPFHAKHACLCGYEWICLTASSLSDPQIEALLHSGRHAA